jgi:hypothetical protein
VLVVITTFPVLGSDHAELWSTKVQPIFDIHCVKCHGPIEQKSDLELDTPEAVFKGGDEGIVVVAGKPDESRLYQYLAPDADTHMPPKKQLSEADIASIHQWITSLASSESSNKPTESTPPRSFGSIPEAIDEHLTDAWYKLSLKPADHIDDRTWARRLYLDLAGRIPTASESAGFLASTAPNKRAELVDHLLASDDYAVRMREL